MTTRPIATVSVDLDPVDVHLRGYGHFDRPPDHLVHAVALPRLLELFEHHGVRATFFVLAREVPSEVDRLGEIMAAGHEIASHGLDHLSGLSRRPEAELRHEVTESRRRLESATGRDVLGFRAPDWSAGPRLISALGDAGYRYDASLVPSAVLTAGRLVLAVRARRRHDLMAVRLPPTFHRAPFQWVAKGRSVTEFPLAVSSRLRIPIYHTIRPSLSDAAFDRHLDGLARRGSPLSYALHGIDVLGLDEDGVDVRLQAHPGMKTPLATKLSLLDRTLATIVARFAAVPFADRLPDVRDVAE